MRNNKFNISFLYVTTNFANALVEIFSFVKLDMISKAIFTEFLLCFFTFCDTKFNKIIKTLLCDLLVLFESLCFSL